VGDQVVEGQRRQVGGGVAEEAQEGGVGLDDALALGLEEEDPLGDLREDRPVAASNGGQRRGDDGSAVRGEASRDRLSSVSMSRSSRSGGLSHYWYLWIHA